MVLDFLIVGAGIGGAVLANLLARAGKRVLVVEKEATPRSIARPEVLWPATVQFLETLLPRSALHELAIVPLSGLEVHYKQATLMRFSPQKFGIQPWSSDGEQTRALLLGEAQCDLERGVEVVGLLKEAGRVIGVRARSASGGVERDILARWVVGDDGGQSVVRRECGIAMSTRTLPVELLSFGFLWPSSVQPGEGRVWINPERARSGLFLLGAISRPAGKGAGLIAVRPKLFQDEGQVQRALDSFCADRRVAEIIGSRRYPSELARVRLGFGHADCYGVAGAVLVGDAAHVVTPAGGQGANAAIADAGVLARIALEDDSQLVEEYERRRRPANARALRLSRSLSWVLALPDCVLAPPLPVAFGLLRAFPGLFARGVRFASTAFLE